VTNVPSPQMDSRPKYPRKVGDLKSLQRMLWWSVLRLRHILEHTEDPELELRAIYCLSTAAGAFIKATEVSDLQQEVASLKALILRRNGHEPPA
jgi:hypothetical protein